MEIKILNKNEEIVFNYLEKDFSFTFEEISKLIDYVISNQNEEIKVIDMTKEHNGENYVTLISEVINGVHSEDFLNSVKEAKKSKEEFDVSKETIKKTDDEELIK